MIDQNRDGVICENDIAAMFQQTGKSTSHYFTRFIISLEKRTLMDNSRFYILMSCFLVSIYRAV